MGGIALLEHISLPLRSRHGPEGQTIRYVHRYMFKWEVTLCFNNNQNAEPIMTQLHT